MEFSNLEVVGRALDAFRIALAPLVREELVRLYPGNWQQKARESLADWQQNNSGELNLDVQALVAILLDRRHQGFVKLRSPKERNLLAEVRTTRNAYAHQEAFSDREVDRALETIELVLEVTGAPGLAALRLRQRNVQVLNDPVVRSSRPAQTITNSRSGSPNTLHPDASGFERGVRLFHFLVGSSNKGQALGVGYAAFVEYLHGKSFVSAMGRPYAQSDTSLVIDIAQEITAKAGRLPVTRSGLTISAGMDTFIWPLKKPHERSTSAWKAGLPYTKEAWGKVFPSHLRKLLAADQLAMLIKK
ncbi:MAG: hypothetical protein EBY17_08395 [Acidobacteriia bacterium]|nr:hypothetical protein [Terriglobia bacterium]